MPFTLAHPAAVLPLRRLGLPVTALVAGTMVPDVPVFLNWWSAYAETHSWLGVVSIDPLATTLVVALWFVVLRDALVDLAPSAIRARLAPHVSLTGRQWLLVPVAAAVGSLTHVGWDSFTHQGRWGVRHVPPPQEQYGALAGYQWAQYGCGVLGCTVVAYAVRSFLRQQPVVPRVRRSPARVSQLAAASALAAVLAGLAGAAWHGPGLQAMAHAGVISALLVLALGTAVACALWWALVGAAPSDGSRRA